MAYYDSRPPYPPADYPEPPSYTYAGGPNGGSHATDVMPHAGPASGPGSRDGYYRNHPARDAYEYGYDDYPSDSRSSRKNRHRASTTSGYYDDPYDEYEPRSRRSRHYDERRGREKYAYSPSTSRSPPRRRRSLSERALGALGLGAAAGAGSKHHGSDRGRSRSRHRGSYSYSPSPVRGSHRPREKSEARIAQAVKAAVTAGAVEAFRARKEPGDWSGPKGKRILTAALAAGGTDGLVDRNPDKHSKRHILESTLAGLATTHLVNGSRSRSRSRRHGGRSRSRSRSRSRGGKAKDVALMGILAAAGKEAYDRYQKSHSRSRPRHRSDSVDSYDDRPRHKRSKSVSDYINKGMAALGLDDKRESSDRDDRRRRHHRSSRYDDYSDDDRYSDDDYYRRHPSPPRTRHSRDVSRPYYIPAAGARSVEDYDHDRSTVGYYSRPGSSVYERPRDSRHRKQEEEQNKDKENGSDATSSTDDFKKLKKANRETIWATTLAAAASVHAAHSLTENMEQHKERSKKIKSGEISPDEARRQKRKNQFSDAASLGVAALSIKSAVAEWQHFNEKRRERANLKKYCKERSRSMKAQSGSGYGAHSRSNPRNSHSHPSQSKSHSSKPQRTQSLNHRPPRTMYPDEIEENWSLPDRTRSVNGGRSPSVMV